MVQTPQGVMNMTFLSRIERPEDFRHWFGDMEAEYVYTSGVAGDTFFNGLKKGKILATRCPHCDRVFLPPRIYCENCFSELTEWIEIPNEGVVETYTVMHVDIEENPLDPPEIRAFIAMEGTDGGLLHKLNVSPDSVEIGMPVKAIFKKEKEREGKITDILYFEP